MQTYDIISFATWLRSYEGEAAQRYAKMTTKRRKNKKKAKLRRVK